MPVRDHEGLVLDQFNGYFNRGDVDTVPFDHFSDCNNIDFIAQSTFRTRPGINISQTVLVPLSNVKRIYNYPTQSANTLIVLTYDPDLGIGSIYHVVDKATIYGPILQVAGMIDFAFQPFAGRGYISPFGNYVNGDLTFQKGLASQFLYVYAGDGTPARQAAGSGMSGTMTVTNGAAGHTDPGQKIFGFVSQTISGYNSPPTILTPFTTFATNSVSFGNIPTSGDLTVVKRLLVASKTISLYNGNPDGYQLFFVPNAIINNNTDTFLNNISFYDSELLSDASHLIRNYTSIPAGAVLSMYHNRLCLACTSTDISLILVSQPGEPEAIDQVSGLIVVPLDGNPITNGQELRDVLYVFKRAKTVAYADNQGDPSSWPLIPIDSALGTSVHGIATVLDSGGASVDYLLVATYGGISKFNGSYDASDIRGVSKALSWKIENFWTKLDRNKFGNIQIVNCPPKKEIFVVLPNRQLLMGNYSNGMDYQNIRWSPWMVRTGLNTVAIHDIDDIILGADIF
jgi:hypothetical protein